MRVIFPSGTDLPPAAPYPNTRYKVTCVVAPTSTPIGPVWNAGFSQEFYRSQFNFTEKTQK
jgi:hypothetical protein